MATYQSGLQSDFWSKYYQRRAQKGSGLSASEMASLYEPMGAFDYQKSLAAAERERQQSNLDRAYALEKQKAEDVASAAKVSGATSLIGTGANIYLGKKLLDIYGGKGATPAIPAASATTGGFAGGEIGTGPAWSEAPGIVSQGAANIGEAALPMAGGGAQASLLPSAYASAPELAAGTGMGEGLAATYGAETAAAPTGASALSYAGPAAAFTAGVLGTKYLGPKVGKALGWSERSGKSAVSTGIMGGAINELVERNFNESTAKVINTIINPVAKITDEVGNLTVICSELEKQKMITRNMKRYASIYGGQIGEDVHAGYTIAATPVVEKMRRSKLFSIAISVIAIPTIKEMAHRVNPREKGSIIGSVVLHYGIPYCIRTNDKRFIRRGILSNV